MTSTLKNLPGRRYYFIQETGEFKSKCELSYKQQIEVSYCLKASSHPLAVSMSALPSWRSTSTYELEEAVAHVKACEEWLEENRRVDTLWAGIIQPMNE